MMDRVKRRDFQTACQLENLLPTIAPCTAFLSSEPRKKPPGFLKLEQIITMKARKRQKICRSVGDASSLLKTLANPDRLSIVCMLMEGECSVGELEQQLGIRQPTLSQQLSELRNAGILTTRREAKYVHYRVADKRAERIVATLRGIYSDLEEWCTGFSPESAPGTGSRPSIDLMRFD